MKNINQLVQFIPLLLYLNGKIICLQVGIFYNIFILIFFLNYYFKRSRKKKYINTFQLGLKSTWNLVLGNTVVYIIFLTLKYVKLDTTITNYDISTQK